MGKCLITRLKGSVDNDNLPIFNTVVLDLVDAASQYRITVGAADENVIVTFADIVHDSTPSGTQIPANTPTTVNAGQRRVFYLKTGQTACENFMKVENVYSIETLISDGGFVVNETSKSGLSSLKYNDGLVQFGGIMTECSVDNCQKVRVIASSVNDEYAIGGTTIQKIVTGSTIPFFTTLPNSVRFLGGKYKGDVKDWPSQLRYYIGQTGQATGELNDFIAKAVAAGRTTGYVALYYQNNGQYQVNITLNGVSLKNNPNAVVLKNRSNIDIVIIQWNGTSNVSFATTKPQDFTDIYDVVDSDLTWEPWV